MSGHDYCTAQFLAYAPLRPEDTKDLRAQLRSEKGRTNWMNIDAIAAKAIEQAIEGSYYRKAEAEGHGANSSYRSEGASNTIASVEHNINHRREANNNQ